MKHDQLCAVAHNLVDSIASGQGFLIGYYAMDVFGEAARSPVGSISINILTGGITKGEGSQSLAKAFSLYSAAFQSFCNKHGTCVEEFAEFSAVFKADPVERYVVVTVVDRHGRHSETEYTGDPLRRMMVLDAKGRFRRKPARCG
ncbi:hypothetical protein [Acidisphaera sp. L21]|uniref:hypothetical protein n=1 Tax=Acidisphaera sp. L21 TaxID=1641851 RepID=UPI00131DBC74|nr:hypothetical protein [Acidisphaera sp. L21]